MTSKVVIYLMQNLRLNNVSNNIFFLLKSVHKQICYKEKS